ncbi:MAG TPA: hypothetical protein VHO25_01320 [Polyangiaceae bacterium]|nr:hypothetical protein [Polyangiaceae bacterium]
MSSFPVNATDPATNAMDESLETRWMTLEPTKGGEWLEIDFSEEVVLPAMILHTVFAQGEGFMVLVDGEALAPHAGPTSQDGELIIYETNGYRGQVVRIQQTGSAPGSYWSVYEIGPYCP